MAAMIVAMGFLGWLLGVVANLLADSLPQTRRMRIPRCSHCSAPRPIAGWSGLTAALTGTWACSFCGASRSLRGPVAELAGLAGTLLLFGRDPKAAVLVPGVLVGFTFLLITIIDLEHRLILHIVVFPAALLLGTMGILDPGRGAIKTLAGGLAGAGSFLLLFLLGEAFARAIARARRRSLDEVAFGFGDVTLAGLIGLIVGWPGVTLALLIGILTAGVFSLGHVLVMLVRRRYNAFTPIAYGPFLILGASLVYYGGGELFQSILLR
jgi:prepilin signal peptidase PulO-like enzyme (type II secretory pathway)